MTDIPDNGPAPYTFDDVPADTIAQILEWVYDGADDTDVIARATVALAREQGETSPRSTLIGKLDELAAADPAPVLEVEPDAETEPYALPAPVPGATYLAREKFTAMVGVQLVTFDAGAIIDRLAGVVLVAARCPVDIVEG